MAEPLGMEKFVEKEEGREGKSPRGQVRLGKALDSKFLVS